MILDPQATSTPATLLLDVGQGDATVIVLPGEPREAIVVDCKDAWVVDRHLRDYKVERLAAVLFTHLDADHIEGGLALVESWKQRLGLVFVDQDGRQLTDDAINAQNARDLFDGLLSIDGPELLPPLRDPRPIAHGEGWRVLVAAPSHKINLADARSGTTHDNNEYSAVVRLIVESGEANHAILLGGDAPLVTWASIPPDELRASVFRTPHHGGALADGGVPEGWSVDTLYDNVQPLHAVVSVGTNNGHGHPAPAWRKPLSNRAGCRVRCTQVTGSCEVRLGDASGRSKNASNLRAQALRWRGRAEAAYRHLTPATLRPKVGSTFKEVPCAGTVAVGFKGGSVRVFPEAADHDGVVEIWSHPWCREPSPQQDEAPNDDLFRLLFED